MTCVYARLHDGLQLILSALGEGTAAMEIILRVSFRFQTHDTHNTAGVQIGLYAAAVYAVKDLAAFDLCDIRNGNIGDRLFFSILGCGFKGLCDGIDLPGNGTHTAGHVLHTFSHGIAHALGGIYHTLDSAGKAGKTA